VRPWGDFTALRLQRAGRLRLVIDFDAGRIGARTARCNGRSGP
jgi:glycine/D-amino acid oxidase-like deaminating enzyme